MNKPKFEKVDDNTIKIIVENANDVPLYNIIENKKKLEGQMENIKKTLKNIDEILESAKRLGITAKQPEKSIKK